MHEVSIEYLFIIGLAVFGGMLGAWGFQKLKVPQVLGYIVIGLIAGESGFRIITSEAINSLAPLNTFALGIIGFLVGGELDIKEFKKYGKQFAAILLGEGVMAFILVGVASLLFMMYIGASFVPALAGGIVFGAIASATDPASTVDVLWEYRSKGVLTTSVTAIVALDDALAMTLYGLGTGAAQMLSGGDASIGHQAIEVGIEIFGALVVGLIGALILTYLLKWFHQSEKSMGFTLGLLVLVIAVSDIYNMDVIMAAMMMGFVASNLNPVRTKRGFELLRGFSAPIYVIFFVFVGARLGLGSMPAWLWGVVGIYVVGRSFGKFSGAWLGAKISKSEPVVAKYLGLGLFCQGGVAIGLSIMAGGKLGNVSLVGDLSLGDAIIYAVTATTLIVQVIGPPMVKYAAMASGEAGRNVTEEDVIAQMDVLAVMESGIDPLLESMSLEDAISRFSKDDFLVYPVVGKDGTICGMVSLSSMKEVIADHDAWKWLVVQDVMEACTMTTNTATKVDELLVDLDDMNLDQVPVVDSVNELLPVGMVRRAHIRKRVAEELLRQQGAV